MLLLRKPGSFGLECRVGMAFEPKATRRTQLYRDPRGLFVHDLILDACHRVGQETAIIDHSTTPQRSLTYAAYGSVVERLAALLSTRFTPGEVLALFVFN